MVVHEAEPVGVDGQGSGFMPEYAVSGVDGAVMRDGVAEALVITKGRIKDTLPSALMTRYRLSRLEESLRDAHFPGNGSERGRQRLAFEELLLLQIGVVLRARKGQTERGFAHTINHKGVGQLGSHNSVYLDDGQEIVFDTIRRDLASHRPMTRLLQSDLGSEQGMVVLFSALSVAENGTQVAIVGPDAEALERRYLFAEPLLRSVGVVSMLVTEPISHAQSDAIRRGEVHVVFGLSGLTDSSVEWNRLGLVVVEEKGEFGLVKTESFKDLSRRPDLLVTTAVPIPSSLAFTVFGEFDVSVVPATREIQTTMTVYDADARDDAYVVAREQVEAGRQALVVFPVRDGQDLLGPKDALRMAEALQSETFPGAAIGVYCSAMTREERFRVFEDFQHRRIDVLVCTTYIEESPSVDNATVMVIEYADMHDVVRLHRLRGHVGRGVRPGNVALVLSDTPEDGSRDKLETVCREMDGFQLAEMDLSERGAKALLGDRSEELPKFSWASPSEDRQLLLRARSEAFRMLAKSPRLDKYPGLIPSIRHWWGGWLGDVLPPETSQKRGHGGRNRRRRRRRR